MMRKNTFLKKRKTCSYNRKIVIYKSQQKSCLNRPQTVMFKNGITSILTSKTEILNFGEIQV